MNPTIRVFEAFAGYGSQALALKRLEKDFPQLHFDFVGISEIDRHAITAYRAIHGDIPNFGDISKINWGGVEIPDFDLFTYSFPCTDISNAGTQRGFEEGSGTRSSLLWECRRAIATKRPKYLLMENVNALLQKKFLPHFKIWTDWLEEQGYRNFYQVLNAKDFGVPQNRRRVFMVSIRDDGDNPSYAFPQPFPLKKRLKDILEKEVDEGFYLRQEQVQRIVAHCEHTTPSAVSKDDLCPEIVGRMNSSQDGAIYNPEKISPCHTAGHGNTPKVIAGSQQDPSSEGEPKVNNDALRPEIVGRMNSSQDGVIYNPEKISPCHTGTHGNTPMITADNQRDITPPHTTPNAMRELL